MSAGPLTGTNEGDGEERDRFWNDMDRILDRLGNGYRLCIPGDLNGWIGNRTRAIITGASGVPGESDNGRRVVEFYAERGLCVGNTYFKHMFYISRVTGVLIDDEQEGFRERRGCIDQKDGEGQDCLESLCRRVCW